MNSSSWPRFSHQGGSIAVEPDERRRSRVHLQKPLPADNDADWENITQPLPATKARPALALPNIESLSSSSPQTFCCSLSRHLWKKRLAEMREVAKVNRFGSVNPISGSDFVREVSQAPSDVWVVVALYKDGIPECGLLIQCLEELAKRYPATKFVKIISTDCIPNYPYRNVPTILVYNNGAVKANYVSMHNFGQRCHLKILYLMMDRVEAARRKNLLLKQNERGSWRRL